MKKILILFVMMFNLVGAETEFADPKPSIIEPRKLIFSISSWDKDEVNHIMVLLFSFESLIPSS